MPHTDIEERAIRKAYKEAEERERASLRRAEVVAVAELKGRLAAKGKSPTPNEIHAAKVEAFKKWASAKNVATWNKPL